MRPDIESLGRACRIIWVKADGAGIEKEDSKKIFDLFSRSSRAAGIQGSGIGLAVAQEIAEQHHGRAWAENGPEKGAVFYIFFSKALRPEGTADAVAAGRGEP